MSTEDAQAILFLRAFPDPLQAAGCIFLAVDRARQQSLFPGIILIAVISHNKCILSVLGNFVDHASCGMSGRKECDYGPVSVNIAGFPKKSRFILLQSMLF